MKQSVYNYTIQLATHLDPHRLADFPGLVVAYLPGGNMLITGEFDRAALHSLLNQIGNLGLVLIAVNRLVDSAPDDPDA